MSQYNTLWHIHFLKIHVKIFNQNLYFMLQFSCETLLIEKMFFPECVFLHILGHLRCPELYIFVWLKFPSFFPFLAFCLNSEHLLSHPGAGASSERRPHVMETTTSKLYEIRVNIDFCVIVCVAAFRRCQYWKCAWDVLHRWLFIDCRRRIILGDPAHKLVHVGE